MRPNKTKIITEEYIQKVAIDDAERQFKLGADRTQSDQQLLDWESTQAFIRGYRAGQRQSGPRDPLPNWPGAIVNFLMRYK